ncbi:hypothetical protein [Aneurinibacillus uraniidurans]|uniref:hypothetical protein n=1 Tax=Aneurinibacillus uraniidurans TaxID=2966586 RepID=UPI00234AFF7C|nr:hypothetical protein [Aneurinibacillus sp. B1]WCN36313.1 hypothetical protein PO771_10465 [Aneurinibacillus sp. B1]
MTDRTGNMVAVAVQGIGGMNAFNAGALQTFREHGIRPDILSVTSGAILSAYYYLDEQNLQALAEFYTKYFQETSEDGVPDEVKFMQYALTGMPDVFRTISPLERYMTSFPLLTWSDWLSFWFPAKTYESIRPDSFFEEIANRFASSDIGIIANAYHFAKDKAVLYTNHAAREKTELSIGEDDNYIVKDMSADGIKSCLQLIQYGEYNGEYDGAYQYNPVLGPLTVADHIILITVETIEKSLKPITSYFDVEDFKLKMLFKNAIYAELNSIELINRLIKEGKLVDSKYKSIQVSMIQPNEYRGYFDYFVETPTFFANGKEQAEEFLNTTAIV